MPLDDLLCDGKPDAAAVILTALVQALEHLKDHLGILAVDTDPIVLDVKGPLVAVSLGANVNARRVLTVKFQRVSDQILKHLRQLNLVGAYGWQRTTDNFRLGLLNRQLQAIEDILQYGFGFDRRRLFPCVSTREKASRSLTSCCIRFAPSTA